MIPYCGFCHSAMLLSVQSRVLAGLLLMLILGIETRASLMSTTENGIELR